MVETCARAAALTRAVVGPKAETLTAAALKFCLSFDAVSVVIPGMRRPAHVNFNVRAADGRYFDPAELAEIGKHRWVRDFYV